MKPASNVKTPAQYIASLPADRAKTIATVRALVNKHIPQRLKTKTGQAQRAKQRAPSANQAADKRVVAKRRRFPA